MDAIKNFSYATVLTAPSPAASGTSLVLNSGQGARFPDPSGDGEYNIVIKPFREIPTSANAEICRVTGRSTDTLTITREQESSSARTIIATDEVYLAMTKKTVDELVTKDDTQTLTNKTLTSPLFQGSIDGWIFANESWAYASATTITVPSGAASKYQKGDKIKITQTTVKYFYIIGVADTVLTVTGGSDYTVANTAITEEWYSKVASPIGFPNGFAFTSAITVSSGGVISASELVVGSLAIQGAVATYNISLTVTFSTAPAAIEGIKITLPVGTKDALVGCATLIDINNTGVLCEGVGNAKIFYILRRGGTAWTTTSYAWRFSTSFIWS